MQRVIPIDGKTLVCANRGASVVRVSSRTLEKWLARSSTSYGLHLTVFEHGKYRLIDERDLRVIAEVNRKLLLLKGKPPERKRGEEMRPYAARLRPALTRAP